MKSWTCTAILLVLVGCAAVPSVPTHLQAVKPAIQQSGGAFSASYSGQFTSSTCSMSHEGTFSFSGAGRGTFIGSSSEVGSMTSVFRFPMCQRYAGSATLTNTVHPRNTLTVSLVQPNSRFGPCAVGPTFTVTSGTGKFAQATGSGTVKFTCHNNGTYTDHWSGTITF